MATPQGGLIRQFTAAMLDRITGRTPPVSGNPGAGTGATDAQMRAAFTPATQFFPSGMPIKPTAPAQVAGRARDFPPYVNLSYVPRSEQGDNAIDFKTLIRMASPADGGLDLLRLAIETRKDQMAAQRWSIRGKKKNDDGGPKARQFEAWLAKPDGVHTFQQWMRMLLEDHFVIDAPTLYFSEVGGRPLWEVIDGSTIKQLITADDGRTPLPPLPAFQQILVGLPGCDYTLDELGYYPYNLLPRRMYGMSRVEQCLITIRTALERAVSQLSYYTEGTTPDGFMELPKDFTLEQVQQWTEWFNSELAGQSDQRHKIRFVLQDSKYTPTKSEILKDQFDEWLARIICYCFSLPPSSLVKETNRATANTTKASAQEEGLEPTKIWFKGIIDDVLLRSGDATLEWEWEDEEIVDPKLKAEVVQTYYGGTTGTAKPIITLAEARAMLGLAPATPAQLLELQPPAPERLDPSQYPPQNGTDPKAPRPPKAETTKVYDKARQSSGGRSLPPLPRNAKRHERTQAGLERIAGRVLTAQRKALAAAIALLPDRTAKVAGFAKSAADDIKDLLAAIEDGFLAWDDDAREEVRTLIEALASEYAEDAVAHVGEYIADADMDAILSQANERAVAWAEDRVGNMITDVSATTRDAVNELNAAAIEHGWTNDEFAAQLSDVFGFSDERALMIARTETAFAETAGTLEGYKASGVVEGKEWSADGEACEDCLPLDGVVVGLDEDFPDDGGDGPPLHPNCFLGETVVSAAGVTAHFARWFEGEVVTVRVAGKQFTVTPNHPILTQRGWVAAGRLQLTDQLFQCSDPRAAIVLLDPDNHHIETRIEEIAGALRVSGRVASVRVPAAAEDFHGDGLSKGEVNVVRTARPLEQRRVASTHKHLANTAFGGGHARRELLAANRPGAQVVQALHAPTDGSVGGGRSPVPLGRPGARRLSDMRLAHGAYNKAVTPKGFSKSDAMAADSLRNVDGGGASLIFGVEGGDVSVEESAPSRFIGGPLVPDEQSSLLEAAFDHLVGNAASRRQTTDGLISGGIRPVQVEEIRQYNFAGHVYNLTTESGWYLAANVIVHNCMCSVAPVVSDEALAGVGTDEE